MVLKFRMFKSDLDSWESLFSQAAAFASEVGRDMVQGISHSRGSTEGLVTVWYWANPK